MIRSLLLAIFVASSVAASGQVFTILGNADPGTSLDVEIPKGKVCEILSFRGGENWVQSPLGEHNMLGVTIPGRRYTSITDYVDRTEQVDRNGRKMIFASHKVLINHIAGPAVLHLITHTSETPLLTYKLTDNIASSTSKPASPKADDIKLTDEFLMLDYTVQANTTYKLGISKDLETWKPLFEFTPESDKLNVELPKIILGNESYLKLE